MLDSVSYRMHGGQSVVELTDANLVIGEAGQALELFNNLPASTIIVHKHHLADAFFDLKSGLAGEILQKASTYRLRIGIIGDFSAYAGRSLGDFIRESNATGSVVFTPTLNEALQRFGQPERTPMRRSDREISDRDEMGDILQRGHVCHLALADKGRPYIVALNYGFVWPESGLLLYFHCASPGKKLDIIERNNEGCFMIDIGHELVKGTKGCDWGMKYRSLVGRGPLSLVDDTEEKRRGLDALMRQYAGERVFHYDEEILHATTVLRMDVREITAKKKS